MEKKDCFVLIIRKIKAEMMIRSFFDTMLCFT